MTIVLCVDYYSIEGDGIEACQVVGIGVVWIVIRLGGIILTRAAVGLVADLEEIRVGVASLPLGIDQRNLGRGILHDTLLTRTVDGLKGEVHAEVEVRTVLIGQIVRVVVCGSTACKGGGIGRTTQEYVVCRLL